MCIRGCAAVLFLAGLAACTSLPSLDPIEGTQAAADGSIPIRDVVKRVKCELYDATKDVQKEYWWFKYWGAKIDLDLIVNEQAGVTPSLAFLDPLPTVKNTLGSFSQSFSMGLNGGLTSNAIRTETVSFSATFLEVRDQLNPQVAKNKLRQFDDCKLPEGSELNGNLGLKQWVDSALGPVRGGDAALLNWGGAVAGSTAKPKAAKSALPPQSIASTKCRWTPGSPPLKNPACRPPIDSIVHTLEFTIVKSAGIAPAWTLVRFKGQTGTGSLASVSRTDTHKLTITLGPSQEDLSAASANQSLRLLAPTLSNALTQAQAPH